MYLQFLEVLALILLLEAGQDLERVGHMNALKG